MPITNDVKVLILYDYSTNVIIEAHCNFFFIKNGQDIFLVSVSDTNFHLNRANCASDWTTSALHTYNKRASAINGN